MGSLTTAACVEMSNAIKRPRKIHPSAGRNSTSTPPAPKQPASRTDSMSNPTATVRRSLRMTLRITGDVWCERQSLYPHVALQLADHHLHASGIIPRVIAPASTGRGDADSSGRFYEHDWACVSQSSRCFRVDGLLSRSLSGVTSTTYVEKVGGSSLQLASSICIDDEGRDGGPDLLSTTRRVFCRLGLGGGPAPFDDDERERLLRLGRPDEDPADVDESLMPELVRFGPSAELLEEAAEAGTDPLLSVKVGPANVNFGDHGDHSFLASTAHHALVLCGAGRDGIAINYRSETFMGDVLDCFAAGEGVVVVARRVEGGRREVACVAS